MKTKIGKGLVVIAFIASLNPYWLVFAVPVFLIGIVHVFNAEGTQRKKVLWVVVPVLLWYPAIRLLVYSLGATSGAPTAQKIDLVFAKDFIGSAMIIPNMPCGQPVIIEEGRAQLKIPQNGILLYQGELEYSPESYKCYYASESGAGLKQIGGLGSGISNTYTQSSQGEMGVWFSEMAFKPIETSKNKPAYKYLLVTVGLVDGAGSYDVFPYPTGYLSVSDSLVQNCKLHGSFSPHRTGFNGSGSHFPTGLTTLCEKPARAEVYPGGTAPGGSAPRRG